MHVFSVSQFVVYLNETFKAVWDPHQACVEGEVSGFRVSQGQWVNFDVKDDPSTGSGHGDALVSVFMVLRQLTLPIQDGMRVRLYGYPRVYPKYGKLSFNAERVELVGEGTLRKALAMLREKLAFEGMFEPSRKRPLPRFPRRIALVASRESAAYGDFIRILNERWGGLEIDLYHVLVQGEQAPGDIVRAIGMAQRVGPRVLPLRHLEALADGSRFKGSGSASPAGRPDGYDALVLTRGGGSFEELMAFNDERVVRAIFASRIPTLVGIGHERDLTLAEEAADVRGSTPTDCARRLVPDRKDVLYEIATQQERISDTLHGWMGDWLDLLTDTVNQADRWIAVLQERLDGIIRLARSFDPAAVVKRGYAIVRDVDGRVRVSVKGLTSGAKLTFVMRDGNADAVVESVYAKKEARP